MNFKSTRDWFGQSSSLRPEMSLQVTEKDLYFALRAQKSPHFDSSHSLGDFVEGLWKQDVAELFLAGEGSGYQEINVSPSGAWWSAYFGEYREFQREIRFHPRIEVERDLNFWQITFTAPLKEILPFQGLEPRQFRFSPTAILYDPEPNYFAWNHSCGGEPDFHKKALFQTIR